mgnify:CR=1 FL=1
MAARPCAGRKPDRRIRAMRDIPTRKEDAMSPTHQTNMTEQLDRLTPDGMTAYVHISITDEPPYALANVIIEALPETSP